MARLKIKVHEARFTRAFMPGEAIDVYDNGRKVETGYGLGGSGVFSEEGYDGCMVFPEVTDLELVDTVYTLVGTESGFKDTVIFTDDQVWTPEEVTDSYAELHYRTPRQFLARVNLSHSVECDALWFEHADTYTAPGTKVVRIGGRAYDTCLMDGTVWLADDLDINDGGDGIIEYKGTTYYTWEAAQRVCPDGWRVPTRSDINNLYDYLGGTHYAGKALRSRKYEGSDTYGFNLVPKGIFLPDDESPRNYGTYAYLWTSSLSGSKGCGWGTNVHTESAYFNSDRKDSFCTVRLIKEP